MALFVGVEDAQGAGVRIRVVPREAGRFSDPEIGAKGCAQRAAQGLFGDRPGESVRLEPSMIAIAGLMKIHVPPLDHGPEFFPGAHRLTHRNLPTLR